jgi:hypothetical protein
MTVQVAVDETKLQQFMRTLIGHMTGAAACFGMWLGDELGPYRALVDGGAVTADALAEKTSCNPRLVREWLDGQAAGKLVTYDSAAETYRLSPEGIMALADDASPVVVARAMNASGRSPGHALNVQRLQRRRLAQLGRSPSATVREHRVVLPHGLPRLPAEHLAARPGRGQRQAPGWRQRGRRRLWTTLLRAEF